MMVKQLGEQMIKHTLENMGLLDSFKLQILMNLNINLVLLILLNFLDLLN